MSRSLDFFDGPPSHSSPLLATQGKAADAKPLYERSQAILEKVQGAEHRDVAELLNKRAMILQSQVRAEEAFRHAWRLSSGGGLFPCSSSAWFTSVARQPVSGGFSRLQGKNAEADPLLVRAIRIGEKSLGPDHPDLAAWLNNRAGVLIRQVSAVRLFWLSSKRSRLPVNGLKSFEDRSLTKPTVGYAGKVR